MFYNRLFTIIILAFLTLIFYSHNIFSQIYPTGWFVVREEQNQDSLLSVYFINSNTGFTSGTRGQILKSTNGGLNWNPQVSGTTQNLVKISFTSANTGYTIGNGGLILKTTNSGENWNFQNSNTTNNLTSFSFINDNTGYITGLNKTLLKTTNGGVIWDNLNFQDSLNLFSIYFIDSMNGCLSAAEFVRFTPIRIMKTTNGGLNWSTKFNYHLATNPIQDLQFSDSLSGWAVYLDKPIDVSFTVRSYDGGESWISQNNVGQNSRYTTFFLNERFGWAGGNNNKMARSTNGGMSWINSMAFIITREYYSLYFIDSLTGWAVGSYGVILKTTTGGILTDFTNISSEIPEDFSLSQNYPNPFNPKTVIYYELRVTSNVRLKVFDVLGNEVVELVNEKHNAGSYSVKFDGSNFASGIYFYSLYIDGSLFETKRMVLLK